MQKVGKCNQNAFLIVAFGSFTNHSEGVAQEHVSVDLVVLETVLDLSHKLVEFL